MSNSCPKSPLSVIDLIRELSFCPPTIYHDDKLMIPAVKNLHNDEDEDFNDYFFNEYNDDTSVVTAAMANTNTRRTLNYINYMQENPTSRSATMTGGNPTSNITRSFTSKPETSTSFTAAHAAVVTSSSSTNLQRPTAECASASAGNVGAFADCFALEDFFCSLRSTLISTATSLTTEIPQTRMSFDSTSNANTNDRAHRRNQDRFVDKFDSKQSIPCTTSSSIGATKDGTTTSSNGITVKFNPLDRHSTSSNSSSELRHLTSRCKRHRRSQHQLIGTTTLEEANASSTSIVQSNNNNNETTPMHTPKKTNSWSKLFL